MNARHKPQTVVKKILAIILIAGRHVGRVVGLGLTEQNKFGYVVTCFSQLCAEIRCDEVKEGKCADERCKKGKVSRV
jgi:hypothetical protein